MMRSAVVLGLVLPLLLGYGTVSATILDTRIAQADTSRPAVPNGFDPPDSAVALLVSPPGRPEVLVFRDFVHVRFDDTTSGVTVRDLFARYGATVAGGYPLTGAYIVHVPDPGPTYDDLEALLTQLRAEPGVATAYRRVKVAPSGSLGRFPDDTALAQADTSRPVVPNGFDSPNSAEALLVAFPGDSNVLVYRDYVHIRFDATTSGVTIRDLFARYGATVAGGYPLTGMYVIHLPDPGPRYDDLDILLIRLRMEPGVVLAYPLVKPSGEGPSRVPDDGSLAQADTSRPVVPNGFDSPDSAVALLVSPPGQPDVLVLRNFVTLEFDDTTSGVTVLDLFARYEATVAGGYPLAGVYIVRVPDPGPTYADLEALLTQLRAEPGVAAALRYVKIEPLYDLGSASTLADTSRPVVPNGFASPDSAVALLVNPPGSDPGLLVFRNFVHIEFDDTTSGVTVRDLFTCYEATVAGGYPFTGTYIIHVPDAGPTYADLEALLTQLREEPGVVTAYRRVKVAPAYNLGRSRAQADTSRPVVPDGFDSPDSAVALFVSRPENPDVLVFRDFVALAFDDTTSGVTIRDVFARYGATIAGGIGDTYIIHVPDPGPTYDDLEALLTQLEAEPGVRGVTRVVKVEPEGNLGRFPDDSTLSRRADWLGVPTMTLATRRYDGSEPRCLLRKADGRATNELGSVRLSVPQSRICNC